MDTVLRVDQEDTRGALTLVLTLAGFEKLLVMHWKENRLA